MITDSFLKIASAQAFAATGVSASSVDKTNAGDDIGTGEELVLGIKCDVSADAGSGDETYEVQIIDDDDPALGSPTILAKLPIPRADLLAGKLFYLGIPPGVSKQRYLGAQVALGGTTPSVTLSLFFQPGKMIQSGKTYPAGYTIA